MTSKLMKVLADPSKIASTLNWRKVSGSILSLHIHKDRIGMAVASHPSFGERTQTLDSIKLLRRGHADADIKEQLAEIVKEFKVCGVVVSWPVQTDTCRPGAACGRILHTLDDLLEDSNVISTSRPLCFWDGRHVEPEPEDEWGRCASYARTTSTHKDIHIASQEQYNQDENVVAAQVWDDFVQSQWPDFHQEEQQQVASTKSSAKTHHRGLWTKTGNSAASTCMKAALV
jgi:RNase H-fold protein (predicted Holliday junction resolvase)